MHLNCIRQPTSKEKQNRRKKRSVTYRKEKKGICDTEKNKICGPSSSHVLKNLCETEQEKSLKIWGATVKETFHLALVGGDW